MIKKFAADAFFLLLLIGLLVVPIGMIGFLPTKYLEKKETVLSGATSRINNKDEIRMMPQVLKSISPETNESSEASLKSGE